MNVEQIGFRLRRAAATLLLVVLGALPVAAQETGSVGGQVFDGDTGRPISGATVILTWPEESGSAEPRQDIEVSGSDGRFRFSSVPPGSYSLGFSKSGYTSPTPSALTVQPNQVHNADAALEPVAASGSGEREGIYDIEEFIVVASPVDMESLLLRVSADELLNVLSAEELSKFAAGDVAEGLQRVAGVNVVEGQFAIIRGLEDRYSSTTLNSAPVPSPDPDSQSVQLDLFPSDVVSNLVVAKTFAPESPSNSAGGSINIVTNQYPESFEFKLSAGGGWNENSWDRYIKYNDGSPIGDEESDDPIESDLGGSFGGRSELWDREIRYKGAFVWEVDYATAEGTVEALEPLPAQERLFPAPPVVVVSGDLGLGELGLSGGKFDQTYSAKIEQSTSFLGFGFDIDRSGNHRVDATFFYTKKKQDTVELKEDGYIPGFDYSLLAEKQNTGQDIVDSDFVGFATKGSWVANGVRANPTEPVTRGPMWFSNFSESESFKRKRDLTLFQLNGDHQIAALEGLGISWAANHVDTNQDESSLATRYFYDPVDPTQIPDCCPATADDIGAGFFAATSGIYSSANDVHEKQNFARLDGDYEKVLFDEVLTLKLSTGGWWEHAKRDVTSSFLESSTVDGLTQYALLAPSAEELGELIFPSLDVNEQTRDIAGLRETDNQAKREIKAWSVGSKLTFWNDVDLLAGFRFENIFISSDNDPFTGETNPVDGTPKIFPDANLFFDRPDNPGRGEVVTPPPPGTTFNDQVLGIKVKKDPDTGLVDLLTRGELEDAVNGEIDQNRALPAFGLTYRPIDGLSLRTAYSQTVARPSFREMGYYVSVEPGTDDFVVGNPRLILSDVESYDARVEYTWGDFGDLVAVSGFIKKIEDPIESIVVRNPRNLDPGSSALFRTFFNNPNNADLQGYELEARKNLEFVGLDFFSYFTLGGNYTYIDAEVDRTDIELERAQAYFPTADGDRARFTELATSRRLFGQPEWIANADLTFDHPDWGTKATLALFAISDVLDAAGVASIAPNGQLDSFTLDRYIGSYSQLDFVLSQTFHVDYLRGDLVFKISAKNLTDTPRRIIYDQEQTNHREDERTFKIGRDYSFSITYQY